MSKLASLQPFKEPPPPEREACAACKVFAPELLVPVGDKAVGMCWLCAHHVVDHGIAPEHAYCAECECTPDRIYPQRCICRLICVEDRKHFTCGVPGHS